MSSSSSSAPATGVRPSSATVAAHGKHESTRQSFLRQLGYVPLIFQDGSPVPESVLGHANPYLTPMPGQKTGGGGGGERQPLLVHEVEASLDSSACCAAGSMASSVFNLCSATLGAGALSLPYAFSQAGLNFSIAQLVLGAIVTVYSIDLLILCRKESRLSSYEDLALHCFGPAMAVFVEVCIFLFCFGAAVSYVITCGDLIQPVALRAFGDGGGLVVERWFIMAVATFALMLPLSLFERVSSLRYSSALGVGSIIYLVFAVTLRSAQFLWWPDSMPASEEPAAAAAAAAAHHDDDAPPPPAIVYWNWSRQCLLAAPIIMFAYTSQVNVFSIYSELQRPSIRKMQRVVHLATLVNLSIYAMMGIFGYMHYGAATESNILLNLSISDPVIALAQFGVGMTVVLAYPLNIFPCRFTVEMMFFAHAERSALRHNLITVTTVVATLVCACYVPGISTVFALLGSTTSSIVCFVLPASFYLKLMDGPFYQMDKLAAWALFWGGLIIGILSTVISVQSIFQ